MLGMFAQIRYSSCGHLQEKGHIYKAEEPAAGGREAGRRPVEGGREEAELSEKLMGSTAEHSQRVVTF